MSNATSLLDEEIAQLQVEIDRYEQELSDLDRGVYHMRLDNGMTLQVGMTGDELRFNEEAILSALGLSRSAAAPVATPAPDVLKNYLPYILMGAGALVLMLIFVGVGLYFSSRNGQPLQQAGTQLPPAWTPAATPTPTVTPTPTMTPTPTPPLIPNDFVGRAPARLSIPSIQGEWQVTKGEWQIGAGQVTLAEEGGQVRYYDSFVGVSNTVIGGDGSTPESPFYLLRSADINDVLLVTDRAQRLFYYRLIPFGGDRVERYIRPDEVWVVEATEKPSLTIIIRIDEQQRMVLRGELFQTKLKVD